MLCVTDVLAADKQLAGEIEFDLRRFEEQEKELQKQQQRRSNVAVSYCDKIYLIIPRMAFCYQFRFTA